MADIVQQYYEKYFDAVLSSKTPIKVATGFKQQMCQINALLANDKTGLVSTILEFMVHSATVDIDFNAKNTNLENILNDWSEVVNSDISEDIPRGLRGFTEQYFRERWKSSFIVIRIKWAKKNGLTMPSRIWVMDGASISVKNSSGSINKNEYYLGNSNSKNAIRLQSSETETIIIRKPYNHWYDKYPIPYLVRKGALYHSLFKSSILERQKEIIQTAFPYQMFVKLGCEEAMRKGLMPTKEELEDWKQNYQTKKSEMSTHPNAKGLTGAIPFDVNFEEIIPDYKKALDEAILKSTDKNLLNALGLIELRGFSSNREEAILNPKVLIEEVNDGVKDYKEIITEIVTLIKEKNSNRYNMRDKVEVVPGVVEAFITDEMRKLIRSLYDRGLVSKESTIESDTSFNYSAELKRRTNETKKNADEIMYPPVIQNQEQSTNTEDIPDDKKPGSPESKNYKVASIKYITKPMKTIRAIPNEIREIIPNKPAQQFFKRAFNDCITACKDQNISASNKEQKAMIYAYNSTKIYMEAPYDKNSDLPKSIKVLPSKAQTIWRKTFNSAINNGYTEEQSIKIAWSEVKKQYKKNPDGKWVKK